MIMYTVAEDHMGDNEIAQVSCFLEREGETFFPLHPGFAIAFKL